MTETKAETKIYEPVPFGSGLRTTRFCASHAGENEDECVQCGYAKDLHPLRYQPLCRNFVSHHYWETCVLEASRRLCTHCLARSDEHPRRYPATPCTRHQVIELGQSEFCIICGFSMPKDPPPSTKNEICKTYYGKYEGRWGDCQRCYNPYDEHVKKLMSTSSHYLPISTLIPFMPPQDAPYFAIKPCIYGSMVKDDHPCDRCGFSKQEHADEYGDFKVIGRSVLVHFPPIMIDGHSRQFEPIRISCTKVCQIFDFVMGKLRSWRIDRQPMFYTAPINADEKTKDAHRWSKIPYTVRVDTDSTGLRLPTKFTYHEKVYDMRSIHSAFIKNVYVILSDKPADSCMVM